MSVSKVSSVGRVDPPSNAPRHTDAVARPSESSAGGDSSSQQPLHETPQRRFPWLSWQTRELEAASKQPSPYGRVPFLGETLDQKV